MNSNTCVTLFNNIPLLRFLAELLWRSLHAVKHEYTKIFANDDAFNTYIYTLHTALRLHFQELLQTPPLPHPSKMRLLLPFLALPFTTCLQISTKILSTNNSITLQTLDPNSYVVVLKSPQNILGTALDVVDDIVNNLKLKPKRKYKNGKLKGFSAILSDTQLSDLKANPRVYICPLNPERKRLTDGMFDKQIDYIEPDAILKTQGVISPSKRALSTQGNSPWNLGRLSHRQKGNNNYVYDSSSGSGTCSYILDTGIYTQHNDFSPSRATLIRNFDTSDNSNDDLSGHGTHVAAIVGGTTYGVAKQTRIYGIKVCNKDGACNLSDIIAGIDLTVADSKTRSCQNGVTMTLSFGAPNANWRSVQDSIVAATQAGIFIVAAAGNDNADSRMFAPASSLGVCSVGASDINDAKASFSNYGNMISVFAPGVQVLSAWIGGGDATVSIIPVYLDPRVYANDLCQRYLDGTSMSAPHIAGLGAYIMGTTGRQNPIGLCNMIKGMATMNVLSGIPGGTPNRLAYNGVA